MTHIGCIYCAYATKDYLARSLAPWIALRQAGQIKVSICAVNVLFAGFEGQDDGTRELLRGYLNRGEIDHLIDGPDNIPEMLARSMALAYLGKQGVDATWLVDSDEYYLPDEINRIIDYVNANPFITWFRISLKNYVGVDDGKTYLAEPFTPPRIHRIKANGYRAHSFGADNDMTYGGTITRDMIPQDRFPSLTIPPSTAWVRHESWPNSPRGKSKTLYQIARWGAQVCSFSWDDSKGGLIFNPALPTPKVIKEA